MSTRRTYERALFRLTTIISRLNLGEALSIPELSEEFKVSVRTVQKDLNLRLAHYPIVKGNDGRYRFEKGFKLTGTSNMEEEAAISMMKSLIHAASPHYGKIVDRIVQETSPHSPFLFQLPMEELGDSATIARVLIQAILYCQPVEFEYTTRDEKEISAFVHPYKLANFQGYWYLIGQCQNERKIKTYYLKHIHRLQMSPETFSRTEVSDAEIENVNEISTVWYNIDNEKKIKLLAIGEAARYLKRYAAPNISVVGTTGEGLTLELSYYHNIEALTFVKRWLPYITILNNPALQMELKIELNNYLKNI